MSEHTRQRWHTCVRAGNIYTEDGRLVVRLSKACALLHSITDDVIADHNACIGIANPETTVPELVAICGRLHDALDEAIQYKSSFLVEKHGDQKLLTEARAVLDKAGQKDA